MSGLLTRFPIKTRQTLLGIYMFKGTDENIRTRYETCLKLKLKNKYTKTTLSNSVLLSLLLSLNVFLLSSSVFIVDFEHLNDGWWLHDFNNRYTSDHQYFKKPDKDAFVFTVAFQSIPKFFGISRKKLSLKFCQ